MSASGTWAICTTVIVFLVVVLIGISAGQRLETEQMKACVENGGEWNFNEGLAPLRVCLKQDHPNG